MALRVGQFLSKAAIQRDDLVNGMILLCSSALMSVMAFGTEATDCRRLTVAGYMAYPLAVKTLWGGADKFGSGQKAAFKNNVSVNNFVGHSGVGKLQQELSM